MGNSWPWSFLTMPFQFPARPLAKAITLRAKQINAERTINLRFIGECSKIAFLSSLPNHSLRTIWLFTPISLSRPGTAAFIRNIIDSSQAPENYSLTYTRNFFKFNLSTGSVLPAGGEITFYERSNYFRKTCFS